MSEYTVISNNPMAAGSHSVQFISGSASKVLKAARDAVHKGAVLVSQPLSHNKCPVLNPYKTVIVTEAQAQLDFKSLRSIEEALVVYKKSADTRIQAYSDDMLDDLQRADMDLMVSALADAQAFL